ncbi:MAG: hypothetical protein IIC24_03860 [Chloroflexi bacterium]|nr:hypothetical protein [Chloroflexota bacterium]
MRVLVFGIVVAFLISIGTLIGGGGEAYAAGEGSNNRACSVFSEFMHPATPGVEVPGELISDAAKDGIRLVKQLKAALCS